MAGMENPYQFRQRPRGLAPHRGVMILVFGVLAMVCCFIFGIVAWVYGNQDLPQMDAGHMDPAGKPLTQAGRILGILSVVFFLLAMVAVGVKIKLLGMDGALHANRWPR